MLRSSPVFSDPRRPMEPTRLLVALTVAISMVLAPAASARGQTYRGPGAAVPQGGGQSGGSPSSGGATSPGEGGGNPTVDPDHWALWWSYNREPFLDLKRFVHAGDGGTVGQDFFLGRGQKGGRPPSLRPSDAQLYGEVVPALIRALENEHFNDVQSAALIALAKIGDRPGAERPLADVLRPYLKHPSQEVSETAALALGILADESTTFLLVDLLYGTTAGRKAQGEGKVPYRTRAFAAYGLGMVGHRTERLEVRRYIVHKLAGALDIDVGGTQDIEIACVLALGLIPLPPDGDVVPLVGGKGPLPPASRSLSAQIRRLADLYGDRSRDVLVRAHAPVAMARLATAGDDALRAEVAEVLLPSLKRFARTRRETLQGAVIALGLIGDADDDEIDQRIRRELIRVAGEEDPLTRSLAIMSLGKLASSPVPGSQEGLDEVRSALLGKLARESATRRPWAGLALAVLERGLTETGGSTSKDVIAALRDSLQKAVSIDEGGGLCIALGIAKASPTAPDLLDRLDRWDEDYAEANAAIGLGLMEANQAIEPLREVLLRSKYRPDLIRGAAISLALLGDKGVVTELVDMLGEARSLSSQAAIAIALGSIGDSRSVEPLLVLLQDQEVTALARAFAAMGLGIVGDKEPLPWNSKFAVDVNYNALTETLTDPATGRGVLDIL